MGFGTDDTGLRPGWDVPLRTEPGTYSGPGLRSIRGAGIGRRFGSTGELDQACPARSDPVLERKALILYPLGVLEFA
jgi:hypothetical protein